MKSYEIVLYLLGSVGGIGVVFTAVIKFSSDIIAKRLEERYSLKLNKELEKYKSIIENKNYISKTKFDTEFKIYRSLSKTFFEMVKNVSIMVPVGFSNQPVDRKDKEVWERKIHKLSKQACVEAQDTLNSNAPFIPEKIFNEYDNILQLCELQLDAFERRWDVFNPAPKEKKERFTAEEYKRTRKISESLNKLNNIVREYLSKLDVIE